MSCFISSLLHEVFITKEMQHNNPGLYALIVKGTRQGLRQDINIGIKQHKRGKVIMVFCSVCFPGCYHSFVTMT